MRKALGDRAAYKYVLFVLKYQARYYESKWAHSTIDEFLDSFTKDIEELLVPNRLMQEMDSKQFRKALNPGSA